MYKHSQCSEEILHKSNIMLTVNMLSYQKCIQIKRIKTVSEFSGSCPVCKLLAWMSSSLEHGSITGEAIYSIDANLSWSGPIYYSYMHVYIIISLQPL